MLHSHSIASTPSCHTGDTGWIPENNIQEPPESNLQNPYNERPLVAACRNGNSDWLEEELGADPTPGSPDVHDPAW